MRKYIVCVAVPVVVLGFACLVFMHKEETLVLTTVLIRHGDKTVTYAYTYKNDPHLNKDYYPYGNGGLTLEGKRRMYRIGKELRRRYDAFLGDVYSSETLMALSSSFPRTKMSLQSLLAGMFPPKPPYLIEDGLDWQPVDFTPIPFEKDDMLAFWKKCDEYLKNSVDMFFSTPEVKEIDRRYNATYEYINKHTGENMTSLFDFAFFYSMFQMQETYGLKLPEWTKNVYPKPLHYLYKEQWKAQIQKYIGIKYGAGRFLKTVGENYMTKVNGTMVEGRKIFVYCGHEYNINCLLGALNITHDYELPFGAYVALELHKFGGHYGVKVFYQDHSSSDPQLKTIAGCHEFCPLERFIDLTKKYYPDPNICQYHIS